MGLPVERVGPYRLQELLGSGGMGQVFAAVHEHTNQQVALKLLKPEAAREPLLVKRFVGEARALGELNHPGVVRIHHCDRLEDGTLYLAMERLHGQSLREWMRAGPASLEDSLAIARQVAEAMVAVHTKGIIHRDLKPENVFLCPDKSATSSWQVKILDFGIAKLPLLEDDSLAETQAHTTQVRLGTQAYMAPEQFRKSARVTDRADVYSLGVLLFELLAGRLPFIADESGDLAEKHEQEQPPFLKECVPALPSGLSALVARMLAKNPAERPGMSQCRDRFTQRWSREQEECPIPGLSPFTEAQAELFFGRRAELSRLLELLEEAHAGGRRWVQLEGPSGIGKSSLVQAGLLPYLRQSAPAGEPRWLVASMRPSNAPLRNLAQALVTACQGSGLNPSVEQVEQALREDKGALQALVAAHTPPGSRLLLAIEQMEELFTLGTAECPQLDELVATALAAPESPLRLLTTVRSDFLHRLKEVPLLEAQLNAAARYHLRPMEERALAEVVNGMARHSGLALDKGLPELLVSEARSEATQLPLLGHALRGLWSLRRGERLTREDYERLGGVAGALAREAEQLLTSLGHEGRERARWLLLDLVQVGRGVPDTRRQRTRREVLKAAGGDELAEQVLERLSGVHDGSRGAAQQGLRLVALTGTAGPGQVYVDLVHEALLQKVPSLVGWVQEERGLLERQADLETAAQVWERAGHEPGALPSGSVLARYRGDDLPTPHQRSHLQRMASEPAQRFLKAAERLEQRRVWSIRALALAWAVAMVAIAYNWVRAERQQKHTEDLLEQLSVPMASFVSSTDWRLGRLPHTLKVRQGTLEGFHKSLTGLSERDQQHPAARRLIIATLHRRADLALNDEPLSQAEEWLLKAREEIDHGLALQVDDDRLRTERAMNRSKLGKVVLQRGQLLLARGHFDEATRLFLDLPRRPDNEADYRRSLATSHFEQAEQRRAEGDLDGATHYCGEALKLFTQNEREGRYDQALLAEIHGFCATIARETKDFQAAESHVHRARDLVLPLTAEEPMDLFFRWILAKTYIEFAALRTDQAQPDEATAYYTQAQELGRELLKGEKENKRYALALIHSLLGQECLARARGDLAQAESLHARWRKVAEEFAARDPEDVRFQRLSCDMRPGEKK